MFVFYLVIGAL